MLSKLLDVIIGSFLLFYAFVTLCNAQYHEFGFCILAFIWFLMFIQEIKQKEKLLNELDKLMKK